MSIYLVTGTSKGIGLELVKQLLQSPATEISRVFAITRSPAPPALQKLIDANPERLTNVIAEVTTQGGVQKAVKEVSAILGDSGLDVLINNAAVSPTSPGALELVQGEQLTETFNVNVVGVQLMIAGFLPLLRKGKEKKVINVSTTMGSVSNAHHWNFPAVQAYRISKASLNMLNKLYAQEYAEEGFTFLAMSPGWVKTDLGSQYADLEPEQSGQAFKELVLGADKSKNGKFVNVRVPGWEDKPMPKTYAGEEILY